MITMHNVMLVKRIMEMIVGRMKLTYDIRDEKVRKFVMAKDEELRTRLVELMLVDKQGARIAACFVDECVVRVDEDAVKKLIEKRIEPRMVAVELEKIDTRGVHGRLATADDTARITVRVKTPRGKQYDEYVMAATLLSWIKCVSRTCTAKIL